MSDIVTELRDLADMGYYDQGVYRQAADEIERLRALLAEGIDHADSAPADQEWIKRVRSALNHC